MGLELTTRIKNNIVERRERLYSNKVNSIPSPFVRFRNDFLGIEQKKEYVISILYHPPLMLKLYAV